MLRLMRPPANRRNCRQVFVRHFSLGRQSASGVSRSRITVGTVGYESFSTFDPVLSTSSHLLHRSASAETVSIQRREVMKCFLGSLHAATITAAIPFRMTTSSSADLAWENEEMELELIVQHDDDKHENNETQVHSMEVLSTDPLENVYGVVEDIYVDDVQEQEQAIATSEDKILSSAVTVVDKVQVGASPISKEQAERIALNKSQVRLDKAIKRGNFESAMETFKELRANDQIVKIHLVASLFFMAEKKPFLAYEIMKYYHAHPQCTGKHLGMYRTLCKSVSLLDPEIAFQGEIHRFINSFLAEVHALDMDIKKQLCPKLVTALVTQRTVNIGKHAGEIYAYMVENDFHMPPGWLLNLLSLSKYNRQEDLPYHDVLERLVASGYKPFPGIVLKAVQNMFPFTDSEAAHVALQAILDLQQNTPSTARLYRMDMGTLEAMATGAARSGNSKLILAVWDSIDQSKFKPTEGIYENTVIAFASTPEGLPNAFSAMASMETDGYAISRALIRSFSHAIR
jgi:uncharacterized membrane protein YkoI